jgi:hypothetical protein
VRLGCPATRQCLLPGGQHFRGKGKKKKQNKKKRKNHQTTKTFLPPKAKAIQAGRSSRLGKMRRGSEGNQMSAVAPASVGGALGMSCRSRVRPALARAYLGCCMSLCSPRGVALAGPRAKRGSRESSLVCPTSGEVGGTRVALVPCSPGRLSSGPGRAAGSRAACRERWRSRPGSDRPVLPRPRGSGGAARASETTAEWGGPGQPPPSPGPRPPPLSEQRRRQALLRAEGSGQAGGRGASAGGAGGGGGVRAANAPPRDRPTLAYQPQWGG